MKSIDFLPAKYREAAAERRTQGWRIVVLAVFVALIGLAAIGQQRIRRSIMTDLEIARRAYERAAAEAAALDRAGAELTPARSLADLLVYLRHPWPRTQVLVAVLQPLPDEVTITTIRIERFGAKAAPPAAPSTTPTTRVLSPAEQDLDRIRAEHDVAHSVVTLEGKMTDLASLHSWLRQIAAAELTQDVELVNVENVEGAGATFAARVTIRQGYGQAHGPAPESTMPSPPSLARTTESAR